MLAGLSDRLGWEANAARSAAGSCPSSTTSAWTTGTARRCYDGRLGHGVPTVVVVRDAVALLGRRRRRSPAAYHRALFGDQGTAGPTPASWTCCGPGCRRRPRRRGRRPGHARSSSRPVCSVSRSSSWRSSHDPGRPWDGDPIELIRVAAVVSDQLDPLVARVKLSARPSHVTTGWREVATLRRHRSVSACRDRGRTSTCSPRSLARRRSLAGAAAPADARRRSPPLPLRRAARCDVLVGVRG